MAVDATGTPTSPDSIPTYTTAADAPSGKGFNAAIAAIQTALSARITKALGTTIGDLIYWSGVSTPARLAVGSTGQVLTVAGGVPTWASSGGAELAYAQITATVNTAATTAATANTVVTAPSFTADGVAAVVIEFSAPYWQGVAGSTAFLELYDNGAAIGTLGQNAATGAVLVSEPARVAFRTVPTAGAHIYSIRGWTTGGTPIVGAGAGGSGVVMPAFIQVKRA